MNASADLNIMNQLEILTGLILPDNHIIGPDSVDMRCRKHIIKYIPTSQFHKVIYPVVKEIKTKRFLYMKIVKKYYLKI